MIPYSEFLKIHEEGDDIYSSIVYIFVSPSIVFEVERFQNQRTETLYFIVNVDKLPIPLHGPLSTRKFPCFITDPITKKTFQLTKEGRRLYYIIDNEMSSAVEV